MAKLHQIRQIQNLIVTDRIMEGLDILSNLYKSDLHIGNQVLAIKGRFNHLKTTLITGVVSSDDERNEYNKIRVAILDLISNIIISEKNISNTKSNKPKKESENNFDDIISVYSFRAKNLIENIKKQYKYIDVEDYVNKLKILHDNHIKALKKKNLMLAYEILQKIYELSSEMENEEKMHKLKKKIKDNKLNKKMEDKILDVLEIVVVQIVS